VLAGEATGGPNPKTTGMREHANSACVFSGQEDYQEYANEPGNWLNQNNVSKPGRLTQTPHYVYNDLGSPEGWVYVMPTAGAPGDSCRGGSGGGD
jgi:hypothetical protein